MLLKKHLNVDDLIEIGGGRLFAVFKYVDKIMRFSNFVLNNPEDRQHRPLVAIVIEFAECKTLVVNNATHSMSDDIFCESFEDAYWVKTVDTISTYSTACTRWCKVILPNGNIGWINCEWIKFKCVSSNNKSNEYIHACAK